MVQERGYNRQVGPAAPAGLPNVNPPAFGAGIGAGIAEVAGALHNSEMRAIQIEREQRRGDEWADFSRQFATLREEADKNEADARSTLTAGGAGYAAARAKWLEERTEALLSNFSDDRARQQASVQLHEYGARLRTQAYQVEAGARVGKRTSDTGQTIGVSSARVDRDPSRYGEENSALIEAIEGMNDVPEDVRDKLLRSAHQQLDTSLIIGTTRADPHQALALLNSGRFDATIPADVSEQLRNRAEIEIRQRDLAVRRAAQERQQDEKETEAQQLQFIGKGGEADPGDLTTMARRAYERGDRTRGDDLIAAATGMKLALPYRNASAQQMTDGLAEIERDPDWRRNPGKVYAHDWIDRRRSEQRTADPAIAAPNWDDRGSVAAFVAKVRSDAAVRGGEPKYLTKDMEASLKPSMGTLSGRQEVLGLIGRFGDAGIQRAAARQLAPDDLAFQGAATLSNSTARQMVLSGQEVLKAKTTPMTPAKGARTFQAYVAPALKGLQGDAAATIAAMTEAVTAELMARRGAEAYSDGIFLEGLHMVLGGTRGPEPRGGLGYWQNGDGRGSRIVLPEGWTQGDFNRVVAAKRGALDGFVGGRRITAEELRQHFVPVFVGGGAYEWEDARGRPLKDGKGNDWRVRLWRK